MQKLQEIYVNFILSSFGKIEMTKLAKLTGSSHDIFTKKLLLNNNLYDKQLWKSIKPLLRDYENEDSGCIVIDDMLMHKLWTKVNDIVCWYYDHVFQKMAKSRNISKKPYTLSCLWFHKIRKTLIKL